ncbi:hypothetical protein OG728_02355 [Streptomyces microflavus]|uniref:hypothetical protein n=1 Tax=Streptomyces sp. PvR018 TaxID=3156442 RepID=UPI002E145324|nr:hypothetical protein OG728_02355 [Streptomyces microflavus]
MPEDISGVGAGMHGGGLDRADHQQRLARRAACPGPGIGTLLLVYGVADVAGNFAGPAKGHFSSSISSSGVIIELLRHLALRTEERVLELGTGTGYTTALLATRTGPRNRRQYGS